MIPATATVDIGPMLDLARLRVQQRDPIGIHRMRGLAIDLDGPRECRGLRAIRDALPVGLARIAVAGPAELNEPRPDWGDDINLLCQHRRDYAWIRACKDGGSRSIRALH